MTPTQAGPPPTSTGGSGGVLQSMLNSSGSVTIPSQGAPNMASGGPGGPPGPPIGPGGAGGPGMGYGGGAGGMPMPQQSPMPAGTMMGMMAQEMPPESGPMMRPGYRPQQMVSQ